MSQSTIFQSCGDGLLHLCNVKASLDGMFLHIWQKAYMEKTHMFFCLHNMQRKHMFLFTLHLPGHLYHHKL